MTSETALTACPLYGAAPPDDKCYNIFKFHEFFLVKCFFLDYNRNTISIEGPSVYKIGGYVMNQEKGKIFHRGRNGKRICVLLIALLLSGLFGCGKKDAYTLSLEGQEITGSSADMGDTGTEDDLGNGMASKRKGFEADEASEGHDFTGSKTVESQDGRIYVHVCGAVKYPGVYEFSGDARVFQAVESAGGFLPEACEASLNQAQPVKDGDRIYVPTKEEWESGLAGPLEETKEAEPDDGLVNINTADENELCTLPGVGQTRAKAIVEYRNEHGSFGRIEDIQNVSGIKSGLFAKIKDYIKAE